MPKVTRRHVFIMPLPAIWFGSCVRNGTSRQSKSTAKNTIQLNGRTEPIPLRALLPFWECFQERSTSGLKEASLSEISWRNACPGKFSSPRKISHGSKNGFDEPDD